MEKFLTFNDSKPISIIFSNEKPKYSKILTIPEDLEISKKANYSDISKEIKNHRKYPESKSQSIEWREI